MGVQWSGASPRRGVGAARRCRPPLCRRLTAPFEQYRFQQPSHLTTASPCPPDRPAGTSRRAMLSGPQQLEAPGGAQPDADGWYTNGRATWFEHPHTGSCGYGVCVCVLGVPGALLRAGVSQRGHPWCGCRPSCRLPSPQALPSHPHTCPRAQASLTATRLALTRWPPCPTSPPSTTPPAGAASSSSAAASARSGAGGRAGGRGGSGLWPGRLVALRAAWPAPACCCSARARRRVFHQPADPLGTCALQPTHPPSPCACSDEGSVDLDRSDACYDTTTRIVIKASDPRGAGACTGQAAALRAVPAARAAEAAPWQRSTRRAPHMPTALLQRLPSTTRRSSTPVRASATRSGAASAGRAASSSTSI